MDRLIRLSISLSLGLILTGCASNGDWASTELRLYLNSNASIESKLDAIKTGVPRGSVPFNPYGSGILMCSPLGIHTVCY